MRLKLRNSFQQDKGLIVYLSTNNAGRTLKLDIRTTGRFY